MQIQAKLAAGASRGRLAEQMSKLTNSCTDLRQLCPPHILRAAAIWGGYFSHKEQNSPPKYLGEKSDIAH